MLAGVLGIFGCSFGGPKLSDVEPKLVEAVLAVPGVTGGDVRLIEASGTPRAVCYLTGSGATSEELLATIDRVLKVVTDHIRPYQYGNASCTITNGTDSASQQGLGFREIVSFDDLRARYP